MDVLFYNKNLTIAVEYYSAVKKDQTESFLGKQMHFETLMLSNVNTGLHVA